MNKLNQYTSISVHVPKVDRIFTVHQSHFGSGTHFGTITLRADSDITMTYETPDQIRAHARELEALAVMLEEKL